MRMVDSLIFRIIRRFEAFYERESLEDLRVSLELCGDKVTLRDGVRIDHPEKLGVGSNVMINTGTIIKAGGGITIGDNVVIGPGVIISTASHCGPIFFGNSTSEGITIGNNVWMGSGVIVNPGVRIGSNVIIASGGVVIGNIPDNSLAAGVPAIVKKQIAQISEFGSKDSVRR